MADISLAVEIAAPGNLVFAFFVPQRMAYWYGAEMASCFEIQGGAAEFQAGQKVRITGRVGSREVSLTTVITRYEWGRILEWRFHDGYGVSGLQNWELAPGSSGTRVRMRDSYEMPGRFGKFTDWLLTRHAVARRDRDALAHLKRLAERK